MVQRWSTGQRTAWGQYTAWGGKHLHPSTPRPATGRKALSLAPYQLAGVYLVFLVLVLMLVLFVPPLAACRCERSTHMRQSRQSPGCQAPGREHSFPANHTLSLLKPCSTSLKSTHWCCYRMARVICYACPSLMHLHQILVKTSVTPRISDHMNSVCSERRMFENGTAAVYALYMCLI